MTFSLLILFLSICHCQCLSVFLIISLIPLIRSILCLYLISVHLSLSVSVYLSLISTGIRLIRQPSRDIFSLYLISVHLSLSVSVCLSVSHQYYVTGVRLIRRPSRDIFCLYQILVHLSVSVCLSLSVHLSLISTMLQVYV